MKSIYAICFFVFFCNGYSQDFSGMFSIDLVKKCKSYTSVDKNGLNAVLFFLNERKIQAVLLNENTAFVDSLSTKSFTNYDKIIAESTSNKISKIVFSNQNFSSFLIQKLDFNSRKVSSKIFSFDTNNKKLLQVFFNNDILYILSYSTLDKNLIITSVSNDEIVSEDVVKIENADYKDFEILNRYTFSVENYKFPIVMIKENEYSTFSETQSLSKGYLKNNSFIICLESSKNGSQIFTINLKDKTAISSYIKRDVSENTISYNSIILENNLLVVEQNKDNFSFEIKDLKGNVLKSISENDVQKSKFFTEIELGRIEEIDSKKYFKKVNNKEIGINYKKKNGNFYINIGSVTNARMPVNEDQSTSYTQIGGLAGGLIGGLIGAIIDSATNSPNMNSNSELVTKGQTFCQIVLDENFNVLESTKMDFSHNKLKKQIINSDSFSIPSIFYMNETYYLGYYREKEKRYFLKKFKD